MLVRLRLESEKSSHNRSSVRKRNDPRGLLFEESHFNASLGYNMQASGYVEANESSMRFTWVIMMTLTFAVERAAKKREATPGRPMRDAPSRLTMATLSIDVIPLMGMLIPFLEDRKLRLSSDLRSAIACVEKKLGLKVSTAQDVAKSIVFQGTRPRTLRSDAAQRSAKRRR
jgi:hypothetical protein